MLKGGGQPERSRPFTRDRIPVCAAIGQAIKCVEMGVTEQISACSDKFAKYNPVRHIKTEQTENTQ